VPSFQSVSGVGNERMAERHGRLSIFIYLVVDVHVSFSRLGLLSLMGRERHKKWQDISRDAGCRKRRDSFLYEAKMRKCGANGRQ
jgi:hypothetical protein